MWLIIIGAYLFVAILLSVFLWSALVPARKLDQKKNSHRILKDPTTLLFSVSSETLPAVTERRVVFC